MSRRPCHSAPSAAERDRVRREAEREGRELTDDELYEDGEHAAEDAEVSDQ